jgi:sugar lactone lactonase YvrE
VLAAAAGIAASAFAQTDYAPPYAITTIAGNIPGGTDGTGAGARFCRPQGVAVDTAGNVYVADTNNNTIRKITPGGVVTTLAGTQGPGGSADGTGSAAQFQTPGAVAVDTAGNLYVADTGNNTIRKISPAGVVTTLAGTAGISGSADGPGSAALFYGPQGIAVDGGGIVYVADTVNCTIRRITPDGVVSTLAGGFVAPPAAYYWLDPNINYGGFADGTGSAALFRNPEGLAIDSEGNLVVADSGNYVIRKVTATGAVTTIAGTPGKYSEDGDGGLFSNPVGVAVDNLGNIYVTDLPNGVIDKITPAGSTGVFAGTYAFGLVGGLGDGTGTAASFDGPEGIAIDRSGNLYVADTFDNAIRKVTPTAVVSTLAGVPFQGGAFDGTGTAASFFGPSGLAIDGAGTLYVADTDNNLIRKVSPAGVVSTLAGGYQGGADGTGSLAQFNKPSGVAVDGSGNVYVADTGNNAIRKVTSDGVVTTLAGKVTTSSLLGYPISNSGSADGAGSAASFWGPDGLAVDADGFVYVADTINCTIRKISPAGVVTTLAGTAGQTGSVDGIGGAAQFLFPQAVAVDGTGNLYVADGVTIRKITPTGTVTTLAGGVEGNADGTGKVAQFQNPYGVALDGVGNIYVADYSSNTIRRVTPAGVVTTLAGSPAPVSYSSADAAIRTASIRSPGNGAPTSVERRSLLSPGSADGTGGAAQFDGPQGIAVDRSGTIYVADTNNDSIRKGSPANVNYITGEPRNLTVSTGATAVFTVAMDETANSAYQWRVSTDGGAIWTNLTNENGISGSTGPQLVIQGAGASANGDYSCVISSAGSVSQSISASLVVENVLNPGTLLNLSARAYVGSSGNILIGGFTIVGTTSRTVLIQALGPALASQGVTGALQHPALTIHDATGAVICSNTGWGSSQVLLDAAAAAYANPVLQPNSGDSEVLLTLPPGGYTAEISGADGGTGVALCAIYELP